MTSFDNIQQLWNQQNDSTAPASPLEKLIELAEKNTRKIKARQYGTIAILGVSILLFVWYIATFTGVGVSWFHTGLLLMLLSLLLRLAIECQSVVSLARMDIRTDSKNYTKRMTGYYKNRKRVHYTVTPFILAAYTTGFLLLLPVFKKSFATGFFLYIVISGGCFLVVFTFFMFKLLKKEIEMLKHLQEIDL